MCTLSSSPPDVHTPHTPHTCTPHTVRLSDGRTLRATDLLAVSSLLGCWDQPRKLHVCPGRYGIVVGSRVRGRSRDALPVTCSRIKLLPLSSGPGAYKLVLILTRHTLAQTRLANRPY